MAMRAPRRRLRIAGLVVLVIFLGWVAFSLVVIQFPQADTARRADAIVVLGPVDGANVAKARQLIAQGISDQLVISTPYGPAPECANPPANVQVLCFVPDPSTTRGEAQEIGRLAQQKGWTDIVVITWATHISRSRGLIEQCYQGALQMVEYDNGAGIGSRIYEDFYQTGAFLKAIFVRAC